MEDEREFSRRDSILETLVITANRHDFKLDLILTVDGKTVNGCLISASDYLKGLGELFEHREGEHSAKLSARFREAGKGARDHETASFIHLTNVTIDGETAAASAYWRGRLDRVSGFVIGKPVKRIQ
ncbi:gas vesicle protein GvpU [Bacillus mangrovi]|uniref:Gas vesicle protein GvpU n=1 Tax=Metabacillus mangrovi TaxID=1491830 RepID=A0A7X2SA97_9BACI|nr:gas vesicle accessory protein GvpU [Metabacillus mangrovi]MTH55386.1 gas vesicle protein GvpU [Metabacillus mangrovi]